MKEPLIVADPKVMMGKPIVAGTRITVDLILEKLGSAESVDAVLEAHPRLTREGILPALRCAAQALRAEVVYPGPRAMAGRGQQPRHRHAALRPPTRLPSRATAT